MEALQQCLTHAALALRPDPRLSVSEWADAHRFLSQTASGEPGPWRTERTPYMREIMDCLSPSSPVEKVIFMKGAQIGGTEAGNNWIGYPSVSRKLSRRLIMMFCFCGAYQRLLLQTIIFLAH